MTLTELSYYIRKLMPFGVLCILLFLVFYYAIKIVFIYSASNNVPAIVTHPDFGKITRPLIPDSTVSSGYSYTLDTVESTPVTATSAAKVFYLPKSNTKFGYKEKINLMAKAFLFDTDASKPELESTDIKYTNDKQSLKVDITNFNFTYQYDHTKDPDLFTNTHVPVDQEIQNRAIDFLKKVDRYPEELARGKTKLQYFSYNPTTTEMTISDVVQQSTNIVEVDFYRPDVDASPTALSTVSPKFYSSQNYVAFVFNEVGEKVIRAQVKFFERSEDKIGVYKIRTGDAAWKDLQEGRGLVVNSHPDQKSVSIKSMFLAYYDPDVFQEYLQPVYVFQGNNDFVAYVPAVDDSYLTK